MITMYQCPICRQPLMKTTCAYRCDHNHTFDIAAQGYVNLLPSNKKKSRNPGDNRQMIAARTAFLQTGWYDKLSDEINDLIKEACPKNPVILDLGCGEGYYAGRLMNSFFLCNQTVNLYGVDISKDAVKAAVKHCKAGKFAVASLFDLPFDENCFDCVYNIFAPVCPAEFRRVLKKNGLLLMVHPGKNHLYGLKEFLYENPYYNEEIEKELEGFVMAGKKKLSYMATLQTPAEIESLFQMTPYYYKTSGQALEKIEKLTQLKTEIDFEIVTYYIK